MKKKNSIAWSRFEQLGNEQLRIGDVAGSQDPVGVDAHYGSRGCRLKEGTVLNAVPSSSTRL